MHTWCVLSCVDRVTRGQCVMVACWCGLHTHPQPRINGTSMHMLLPLLLLLLDACIALCCTTCLLCCHACAGCCLHPHWMCPRRPPAAGPSWSRSSWYCASGSCPDPVTTNDYTVTLTPPPNGGSCSATRGGTSSLLDDLSCSQQLCTVQVTCTSVPAGRYTLTEAAGSLSPRAAPVCVEVSALATGSRGAPVCRRCSAATGCCLPAIARLQGTGRGCTRQVLDYPWMFSYTEGMVCWSAQTQMHLTHRAHVLLLAYTRKCSPHPCRCL